MTCGQGTHRLQLRIARNNWGVIGSEVGGQTAAVLHPVIGNCKHLGIDLFAYPCEVLPGLFTLGERPTAEQLLIGSRTDGC